MTPDHVSLEGLMTSNTHFWDTLAVKTYRSLLRQKKDHPLVNQNLGLLYARIGKEQLALRHLKKALRQDPSLVDIHYHLENLYRNMDRLKEAEKHRAAFAEANPRPNPKGARKVNSFASLIQGIEDSKA